MSFCKVGRLTRDAEVRQTQSGMSVANIGIAVDHGFGDNKGTIFLDGSLWGKQAESGLIKFLKKGRLIYVEGELGEKEYNGKKSLTLNISHIDPCFNNNHTIDDAINGGQGQQQNNQQQGNPQQRQAPQQFNNQMSQAPQGYAQPKLNDKGEELDEFGNVKDPIPF